MVNYANGKIYKITGGCLIYIGSTTQPLYKRLNEHKNQKVSFERGNKLKYCSSAELLKFEDCCITLIEDYPCERREQLLARERYHYDQFDCVNIKKPMRTSEEKILENSLKWKNLPIEQKIRHNERGKERYYENIEKERQRNREKYYRTIETTKAYLEKNKEMLKAKRIEKIICSCGIETTRGGMGSHKKSKFHLETPIDDIEQMKQFGII